MTTAPSGSLPAETLGMSEAELLCDTISTLAESPVWDEKRQVLFWCDILGKTVRSAALTPGQYREWSFPSTVSSLGLCDNGDLIIACGMDIVFLDPESGAIHTLCSIPAPEGAPFRLNDGRVGPDGAFWVGTMHNVPLAQMERVAPNGCRPASPAPMGLPSREMVRSCGRAIPSKDGSVAALSTRAAAFSMKAFWLRR